MIAFSPHFQAMIRDSLRARPLADGEVRHIVDEYAVAHERPDGYEEMAKLKVDGVSYRLLFKMITDA